MEINDNTFTNGEIVVAYDPQLCQHAGKCCQELPEVFRNSVIPWIDIEAAKTMAIIKQIKNCPSGALSFSYSESLQLVK